MSGPVSSRWVGGAWLGSRPRGVARTLGGRLGPLVGLALMLVACHGGALLSPVMSEARTVHPEPDATKRLTLLRELVFDDASPPRNELRLPAGTYTLEASDEEYWYLRSGPPLLLEETHKGGKQDHRRLGGGIMLGKYTFRAIPAAVYIDGDSAATRILIWKLPGSFLGSEGRDWRRSF